MPNKRMVNRVKIQERKKKVSKENSKTPLIVSCSTP